MTTVRTAAKRPVTAEDLFHINVVSDPQGSPDGKLIAYVVTTPDKEADDYRSAIWIAPVDGGEPWMLTSGAFRDTTPRWSPDGTTIAFVSTRPLMRQSPAEEKSETREAKPARATEGKPTKNPAQIWTIAVAGGEARQVTAQRHGADAPAWSPDGTTIAFTAQVEDKDENDEKPVADERVIRKIRYRFNGMGYLDRFRHLFTIPAAGGEATQLRATGNR